MNKYLKVMWHHNFDDEPVALLSEIVDGEEVRKVEVYRDGHSDFADEVENTGSTHLADVLMPSIEEIASQSEFTPFEIDAATFEEAWIRAKLEHRFE